MTDLESYAADHGIALCRHLDAGEPIERRERTCWSLRGCALYGTCTLGGQGPHVCRFCEDFDPIKD